MSQREEYLTLVELCERIKFSKQTIYNMIHKKRLIAGKHFLKPTPKKLLFKWSEMESWLGESSVSDPSDHFSSSPAVKKPVSIINI